MQAFLGFTISSILKSFLVHFSSSMSAQNQQVLKDPLFVRQKETNLSAKNNYFLMQKFSVFWSKTRENMQRKE